MNSGGPYFIKMIHGRVVDWMLKLRVIVKTICAGESSLINTVNNTPAQISKLQSRVR